MSGFLNLTLRLGGWDMRNKTWLALLLAVFPAISHAWWNDDWAYRKKLTLDTTATGAGIQTTLDDVPVLVRLHTGNFNYFLDVMPEGADLRFVAGDDKTPLKYHVEKFDAINEMALIWVREPQLAGASNGNAIWMYYGNKNAVKGDDAPATYDKNQAVAYHFAAENNFTKDETANANNPSAMTFESNPAGIIGGGASFSGNNSVTIPGSPSVRLVPKNGWTFSTWIKLEAPQKDAYVLHGQDGGVSFALGIDATSAYARFTDAGGRSYETPKSAALTTGAWHHLAIVASEGRLQLFIDGVEAANTPALLAEMGGALSIGAAANGTHGLTGILDEVEISNAARSPDWIKAAATGQGIDAKLLALGEDETKQSGGTSYFSVILQNVTLDGWVVIIILVVMAAISWVVMIGKGLIISRIGKDNKAFLQRYHETEADDPSALDEPESEEERALQDSPISAALFGKHDHFQSSSLYHVYHAGIQALHHRLGKAVGAQVSGLTPQAIDTIRAALDAAVVRETQKLNSQMVLLTIAISGGPFLGLLGTVVGVMITFAAIAASGDVNINAIAPGIAAALVATVAGLAVAIPALFGYNYLGSRVKEAVADMQVFVDEFITSIAEHYAR